MREVLNNLNQDINLPLFVERTMGKNDLSTKNYIVWRVAPSSFGNFNDSHENLW